MIASSARVPLLDVLAMSLPGADDTAFLSACLLDAAAARAGLELWLRSVGDLHVSLLTDHVGNKRLLPLLYDHLRAVGVEPPHDLDVLLKTAYVREELRGATFAKLAADALGRLAAANLRLLLVRGVALVPTVYSGRWELRHCHDVDLLVDSADLPRAVAVLQDAGFHDVHIWSRADPTLQNADGLTISLHERAFARAIYALPFDDLWKRSRALDVLGATWRVPAAEDFLLHICVHEASQGSANGLPWAGDVYRLLESTALDWDVIVARAETYRLALPLALMLGYVAGALGGRVPESALARLRALAARADQASVETALHDALVGHRVANGALLRVIGGSPARGAVLRWLSLPSVEYMRVFEPRVRFAEPPLVYALRPLRFVRRRLRAKLRSVNNNKVP